MGGNHAPGKQATEIALAPYGRRSELTSGPKTRAKTESYCAVQLGSYRSGARAERGWTILRKSAQDLLNGLRHRVVRADLGPEKGIYYLLRSETLADKASGVQLCAALGQRGIDCLLVKDRNDSSPS